MLTVMVLFFTKHFVVDFLAQSKWMAFNKHNPLHPGGYVHAGLHGAATAFILHSFPNFWVVALMEAAAHYLIDCGKMNVCSAMNWHPKTSAFWYALGLDQYLHYLTYALILYYYFGV